MSTTVLSLPYEWIYCYSKSQDETGKHKKGYVGFKKNWTYQRALTEMEQDAHSGTKVLGVLRQIPLKKTGLLVIDIDVDCHYMDVYRQFPALQNTLRVAGNTKGWHFYVYCEYATKNMIGALYALGGDIIVEQIFEKEGKEWSKDPIQTLSLQDLQNMLKHDITIEEEPTTDTESVITEPEELITVNPEEVKEYIRHELLPYDGTYEEWRNIGFALFHTFGSSGFELFDTFSKQSKTKYNPTDTDRFYKSIKPTTGKRVGIGTLRKYACKKNKAVFDSIFKRYAKDAKEYADNDNEATKIVLDQLKHRLLFANQHYFKLNNVWINDREKINASIMNYIMELSLWKTVGQKEILYWSNYSSAEKLAKCVMQRIILEPTDYNKFHTTMKYRLCFKNGILDFKKKQFYTWKEIDFECYPVVQIPVDYEIGNPRIMTTIVDKVLEPLFGEQLSLALKYLARSIAGCTEDKNFATYLGNRGCGKGVLFELLGAFGDYVGAFPIMNILCDRNKKGNETSRDLYWLMEFEFMRLAVSQEIPDEGVNMKLKNELVKKVCSGGDTQTARRNYDKRDTQFKVETSLFLMGNDPVKMEGDVLEHHIGFGSAIQFKSQEFIDKVIEELGADATPKQKEIAVMKYRVADSTIKDLCASPEWRMAFIQLVFNAFEDKPISVECSVSVANPIMDRFYQEFIITTDENDVVVGTDLEHLGRKIGAELKAIGIKVKKCENKENTQYYKKMCYHCIKHIT
jgi:hypothetical protein